MTAPEKHSFTDFSEVHFIQKLFALFIFKAPLFHGLFKIFLIVIYSCSLCGLQYLSACYSKNLILEVAQFLFKIKVSLDIYNWTILYFFYLLYSVQYIVYDFVVSVVLVCYNSCPVPIKIYNLTSAGFTSFRTIAPPCLSSCAL